MGACISNEANLGKTTNSNMKANPRKKFTKEQVKMQEARERQKEAFMKQRKEKEERRAGDCEFAKGITQAQSDETPLLALSKSTHFSLQVLRQLEALFNQISDAQISDSFIDRDELAEAMGLRSQSMLLDTIFRLFDATSSKKINFRTWVITLSSLSTKASMDEKMRFSFNLYDLNGDGTIDLAELHSLLESAVKENVVDMSDEDVRSICDYTLAHVDSDGNGQVDYEEYAAMVGTSSKFIESFSIDVELLCRMLTRRNNARIAQASAAAAGNGEGSRDTASGAESSSNQAEMDDIGNAEALPLGDQLSHQTILRRQDAFKNRKIFFPDSELDVFASGENAEEKKRAREKDKDDSESDVLSSNALGSPSHAQGTLSPLAEGEESDDESGQTHARASLNKPRVNRGSEDNNGNVSAGAHSKHAIAQKEKMEMNMAKLARTPHKVSRVPVTDEPELLNDGEHEQKRTSGESDTEVVPLIIKTASNDITIATTPLTVSTPLSPRANVSTTGVVTPGMTGSGYWGNSFRGGSGSGSYPSMHTGRVSLSHKLGPTTYQPVAPEDEAFILESDNRYVNSVCPDDEDGDDDNVVNRIIPGSPLSITGNKKEGINSGSESVIDLYTIVYSNGVEEPNGVRVIEIENLNELEVDNPEDDLATAQKPTAGKNALAKLLEQRNGELSLSPQPSL